MVVADAVKDVCGKGDKGNGKGKGNGKKVKVQSESDLMMSTGDLRSVAVAAFRRRPASKRKTEANVIAGMSASSSSSAASGAHRWIGNRVNVVMAAVNTGNLPKG